MDETRIISESEKAGNDLILKAASIAKELSETESKISSNRMKTALREVLTEGDQNDMIINLKRVPLICNEIKGIHEVLKRGEDSFLDIKKNYVTKDSFKPLSLAVYGLYGLLAMIIVELLHLITK